jgi:pSer/pThr/pTyr-binding forkhead associated (FHA) protein
MANPLSHVEDLAEQLVEGTFARMFRTRLQPIEVARRIARAMEDGQVINARGEIIVPNAYQVYLNPDDWQALQSYQDMLQDELTRYISSLARNAGATMPGRPRVFLQANATVSLKRVHVDARIYSARQQTVEPGQTQTMPSLQEPADTAPQYVLSDGYRRMPIGEAVVTIGRDLDNDIILDDKHVSRQHAQLRRRYGQYVLYDLDSTAGTLVNGHKVREAPLRPGDTITFGKVKIRLELVETVPDLPEPRTPPITRPVRVQGRDKDS